MLLSRSIPPQSAVPRPGIQRLASRGVYFFHIRVILVLHVFHDTGAQCSVALRLARPSSLLVSSHSKRSDIARASADTTTATIIASVISASPKIKPPPAVGSVRAATSRRPNVLLVSYAAFLVGFATFLADLAFADLAFAAFAGAFSDATTSS